MDFDFDDDQNSLRDAVARWVERDFGFERRHAIAKAGGRTREVYEQLAGLGLPGLAVSADHGGLGFGPVEAMVVMEELGRGLVNAPYAEAALVVPALLATALPEVQAAWLPRVAEGSALLVPALLERGARHPLGRVACKASNTAHGWQLTGAKSLVPAGDEADAFVVLARVSGEVGSLQGLALFVVPRDAAGLTVSGSPTHDGARVAQLEFKDTPATLALADAGAQAERAVDIGIASACAEGVGLMDRLTAVTIDYMNTRKQFGVPIASFQALRHRMAEVKMQLELARSMSYYATLKLGEPAQARRRAISQAKVQLGRSMRLVSQECLQMHGGIGVTDEYIASHLFKRLTMLEMIGGDTLYHLGEVSTRMQDTAGVFA